MAGKPANHPKHVPQRTCVGCRSVLPKRALIRIVHRAEDVQVDLTGKLAGRGAYLHNVRLCWEKALKGPLSSALKVKLDPDDLERLHRFMQTLPEDSPAVGNYE